MEIPERYLHQAQEEYCEKLIDYMEGGKGDLELLWAEIERMLLSRTKADDDAIRGMTIHDVILRVCETEAEIRMDAGDLDEKAEELMRGAAESFADRDR